jgi:hypothetical protein
MAQLGYGQGKPVPQRSHRPTLGRMALYHNYMELAVRWLLLRLKNNKDKR